MASVFQQLGAYVYTGVNLGTDRLDHFRSVGGKQICLLVYNDDAVANDNKALLPGLRAQCSNRGISIWGWFNGRGGDYVADARAIVGLYTNLNLKGMHIDLEAEYQNDGAAKMPALLNEIMNLTRNFSVKPPIIVNTNGMNNSMIWNGRTLDTPKSVGAMGVRVSPQWYDCYYRKDAHTTPQAQMEWLLKNGNKDFNFKDPHATKTTPKFQGLPRSFVHPSIEGTGMEATVSPGGCSVEREINDCLEARAFGLTAGLWYYTLEAGPEQDLDLISKQRGVLYLV